MSRGTAGIKKREYNRKDGSKRVVYRARFLKPDDQDYVTQQIEQSFPTRREAEIWLTQQKNNVYQGSWTDHRRGDRPLSEVAEAWRSTWINKAENTKLGYHYTLNKHIIGTADKPARFFRAKVGGVTAHAIQAWVNDLAKSYTPAHVERVYGVLRSILNYAVDHDYILKNPCRKVELPTKTAKPSRDGHTILSPAEVRALAEAVGPYGVAVYVASYCGLRAGELWGLRRSDVDTRAGKIRVHWALKEVTGTAGMAAGFAVGHPKTKESRRSVSVPKPIMAMLVEYLAKETPPGREGYPVVRTLGKEHAELQWTDDAADPDRLLFVTPVRQPKDSGRWGAVGGYPIRHGQFYKRVFRPAVVGREARPARRVRTGNGRRLIPAQPAIPAALPASKRTLRWHDLRHTCASLSLAVAPNLHMVKERLGHKDIRMTVNTYGHLVPSVDDKLSEGLAAMFEADNVVQLRPAGQEPLRRVEGQ